MKVRIVNKSKHQIPEYYIKDYSDIYLRENICNEIIIKTMDGTLVKTGLFVGLPERFMMQKRAGNGCALTRRKTFLNSPGTINSDCRGEIREILVNLSTEEFNVKDAERISQKIISKHERLEFEPVALLKHTEGNSGDFRQTGIE